MQYSVETDLRSSPGSAKPIGPGLFDGRIQGFDSPDPIFIVGMPRTGTTLVERILGSHPAVFSAGELNNFSLALIPLVQRPRARGACRASNSSTASARVDFHARSARPTWLRRDRSGMRARISSTSCHSISCTRA